MLNIPAHIVESIKAHAARAYPEECCGILLGSDDGLAKSIAEIQELENTKADERERRYLISPEQYKAAETEAKNKRFDIIGLYHSHPDHPSRPSAFDREHALPYWSYVIVSVEKGQPKKVTSWVLKDDRTEFDEEPIKIHTAVHAKGAM